MNPLEPGTSEAINAVDLPLSAPDPGGLAQNFTAEELASLRRAVHDSARACGLAGDALDDFVVAVHELATNAVRHGGGRGRIDLRRDGDTLLCDIIDHGPGFPGGVPTPAGLPSPQTPGGRGLWLAQHLTDTLLITDSPGGVTVSVTACLPAPAPSGLPAPILADEWGQAQVEISPGVLVQATTNPTRAPHPVTATEPDTAKNAPEATGPREA
uniref:ATP-binding protein n=1 Tax=Paractinoplanes polyasparticus TaxID=2856853 RepID=UPI001C85DDA6|nr:ATP-binding protein [Actinoplanes polyasparticus]